MDSYLRQAFQDLYQEDGLTVLARGLGIHALFAKFVKYYSQPVGAAKKLVFCVNSNEIFDFVCYSLLKDGVDTACLPKLITNEILTQDRTDLYMQGGCFFVTSRIFIVDLLDGKVDPSIVAGLLIANAHRVSETSLESFIVRVYRDRNTVGFVKAFTDEPESLVSGFGKVERLMKALYVKKLYLWPRFQLTVSEALDKYQPEVIELTQPLTENMKAIQGAVLVTMKSCIAELKKAVPQLDTSFMSLENGLFKSFDLALKSQLDPEWHKLSPRTKQLVHDVGQLRKLLDYLLRYDAYTFYSFLVSLRAASALQVYPSLWLTSQASELLFRKAKDRIYTLINTPPAKSPLNLTKKLRAVKECQPKWQLLSDIMKEIRAIYQQYASKLQDQKASKSKKSKVDKSSSSSIPTSSSNISADGSGDDGALNGRVLVYVKDERTAMHVRDILAFGLAYVMDQRHRWFVSQQAADIRPTKNQSTRPILSSTTLGTVDETTASVTSTVTETTTASSDYLGLGVSKTVFDKLSDENKLILFHELELRAQPGILPPRAHQGTPAQQLLNLDDSFDEDINEDLPTDETITIQPTTSTATTTASSKKSDNNTKVTNTADTSKFSSVLKRKAVQRDKAHADGTTAGEEEYIDVFRIMRDTEAKYDRTATEMYLGLSNIATSSSFTSSVTLHAHGHRERHKKYVIQNSTKGQGHDKTQSKLKANSSSHKDVIHIDMDNKIEMVDDSDDDDDEEDEEKDEDDQIILVASAFHVIVVAHSESAAPQTNLLDEVRPGFIVMYDADMGVVRSIEVYNAQHSSRIQPLKVYLLMYENSVEEHRYMTLVAKEKRSFEQLIIAKETLVISLPDNAVDLEKERLLTLDGGVHSSDTRISNKNNGIDKKNMKIVVDVRDFRSTLPSLLYGGGLAVVPRTLLVGDYVLSAEVCVERKGISDLFQSLASGRLYNQAESMSKYYSHPCLLIEFTPDRAFSLQSAAEISTDSIQSSSIITRLVQLALAFPQLRVLWSRTPHDTVSLFLALMNRHQEVDVEKAVQAGGADNGSGGTSGGTAERDDECDNEDSRLVAQDLLLSLPGITVHNFRAVMTEVRDIAELSSLSEAKLIKMIGQVNGKKLHEFFREKLPST